MGDCYWVAAEDAELRKRLDELEASMMQQENKRSNMDEQVALMEKSYQLAAKYMPGGNANAASPSSAETATEENKEAVTKGKKAKVSPVRWFVCRQVRLRYTWL